LSADLNRLSYLWLDCFSFMAWLVVLCWWLTGNKVNLCWLGLLSTGMDDLLHVEYPGIWPSHPRDQVSLALSLVLGVIVTAAIKWEMSISV